MQHSRSEPAALQDMYDFVEFSISSLGVEILLKRLAVEDTLLQNVLTVGAVLSHCMISTGMHRNDRIQILGRLCPRFIPYIAFFHVIPSIPFSTRSTSSFKLSWRYGSVYFPLNTSWWADPCRWIMRQFHRQKCFSISHSVILNMMNNS